MCSVSTPETHSTDEFIAEPEGARRLGRQLLSRAGKDAIRAAGFSAPGHGAKHSGARTWVAHRRRAGASAARLVAAVVYRCRRGAAAVRHLSAGVKRS